MSVSYLQGLFSLKLNDFIESKELMNLFSEKKLENFDESFRQIVAKKFSSSTQKKEFLEKDIAFHQRAISSQKEDQTAAFLQGIVLPFDYYNLVVLFSNDSSIKSIRFFTPQNLEDLILEKFSTAHLLPQIKDFCRDYKNLKSKKEKDRLLDRAVKINQREILRISQSQLIRDYFEVEEAINLNKTEIIREKIPSFSSKFLLEKRFSEFELFKFYLPYFITGGFLSRSNPFEFVFIYLKRRFMFWKLLDHHSI